MPLYCIVKGCKNMSGRGHDVKFHRLPVNNVKNCREWLIRAGMTDKELKDVTVSQCRNWRICSAHFQSARQTQEPFLPTIGLPDYERKLAATGLLQLHDSQGTASSSTNGTYTGSSEASIQESSAMQGDQMVQSHSIITGQAIPQSEEVQVDQISPSESIATAPEEVASAVSSQASCKPAQSKRKLFRETESQVTPKDPKKQRTKGLQKTPPTSRHTEITPKSRRSTMSNTELRLTKDVQTPIPAQNFIVKKTTSTQTVIATENKSVQACLEKIELLKTSDKELKKYTGIENYKLFQILHKYLVSQCSDSICTIQTHSDDPSKLYSHISTENQLLLVLYKLKRNPVDSVLSSEFHVSTGRISEIFKFWIRRMYRKFKIIKIWPSHENVQKYMPSATKQHFPDLVAISDCVEFSTQVPRAPLPGKQLFSNYKNCHTVKVMYSTAPNGALIHCSDAYGGNSSDKEIFAQFVN
ncbi:uncharacterized protein LOC128551516 isoform X1 [Mercenaria mercenaria]|uniref:uncharacterized protein LOC128551516 isoform X1 n=1 Tax=Mercenaria mercenaria TaxID=6596 RepID=UPI00234EF5D7|nr:uncharacterized protein LOC128551516 isoform X1 [Mercenaria mercenaria]